jgi:MFS family permease
VFEARIAHPVLDVRLFRQNRAYGLSNLAAMVTYSATFAVAYFLSPYLQSVKGLDPRSAGFAMVVQPVLQAALSPLAGRLSDRVEPRLLASAGMGVTSVGLGMLVLLEADTSMVYVEAALALLGVGFALFSSPNMNAIMGSVGPRQLGVANATLATMRVVGQMLSMAFALLLLSLLVGRVQIDAASAGAFLHALRTCFAVFSALCAAGIFASLARGTMHGSPPRDARARGPADERGPAA